jgi:hypothetical protein
MADSQVLLDISSICVIHDEYNQWLYVDWKGPQDPESVRGGCEQVLQFLRATGCRKILNDNTNATGDWEKAARWIGQECLPSLAAAGLQYMAWVYSPNYISRRAIDTTLSFITIPVVVSFEDVAAAYAWLRSCVRQRQLT